MARYFLLALMLCFIGGIYFIVCEMKSSMELTKGRLWYDRRRIWCGYPCTFTIYSFDNDRFFLDTGFLNKKSEEVRLYRISDLTVTRSLLQRMFGLGTILIKSSDQSLSDFSIKNIKDSLAVKEQLSQLVEQSRSNKKNIIVEEA